MKTNQSINSFVSQKHPVGSEVAIKEHLDDAKRDLVATADRIYDDEDDDYTDSQFGTQQPLTQLQQFKHLQVTRATPEFVQEQSLHDEYAYSPPVPAGSALRRSQPAKIPERPSKPKKNESRMQKQTENTKSTYLDDIKVDAREITESISQPDIMSNTAPG